MANDPRFGHYSSGEVVILPSFTNIPKITVAMLNEDGIPIPKYYQALEPQDAINPMAYTDHDNLMATLELIENIVTATSAQKLYKKYWLPFCQQYAIAMLYCLGWTQLKENIKALVDQVERNGLVQYGHDDRIELNSYYSLAEVGGIFYLAASSTFGQIIQGRLFTAYKEAVRSIRPIWELNLLRLTGLCFVEEG